VIEVKNVRPWIYPRARELFQLLDKAARLAAAYPDRLIAPALVCRKRHYVTHQMGFDLGFFTHETFNQFVLPVEGTDLDRFDAVRTELGYEDLLLHSVAHDLTTAWLVDTFGKYANNVASQWRKVGALFGEHYQSLRRTTLSTAGRAEVLQELRDAAASDMRPGWSPRW